LNILYLHQYFKKPDSSGGVRSYEFAKRLAKDGHEVHIITSDTDNSFRGWNVEVFENITIHWISIKYNNRFGFFSRLLAFFKFILHASFRVVSLQSDQLIASSTPLTVAVPALIYRLIKRKPYIFEVRDVWPEVPIALGIIKNKLLISICEYLEVLAYMHAKSIIVLSKDMASSIISRTNLDGIDINVIPNASDIDLFRDISNEPVDDSILKPLLKIRENHKKIVFYTGTLGFVNNLSYLIDLASFSNGDVAFVIVGDGREKELLLNYANSLGILNSTVYFFPSVKKNQLYILHDIFDVSCSTVLPIDELYANSANKVFDAFASGTPILINHGGWIKNLIDETGCGIYLNEQVSLTEYNKLLNFLNNSTEFDLAKLASYQLGSEDFNRDNLYMKFKEVVEHETIF
jgi:glycosyltransferase involved in cell wall biosynthesis